MTMSASERRFIQFMSGPWGRGLRIAGGLTLAGVAITGGSWLLLLLLPAALMVTTGVMNYCPAGLMMSKPTNRSEFMASLKPVNMLDPK